jgi:nicotinamide mononucleotide adenylyltransferase
MASSSCCLASPYALRTDKLKPLTATSATTLDSTLQPAVVAICGSFNPIHNAHLKLYEAAKATLESDAHHHGYTVLGGFFSPVSDAYGKPGLRCAAQRVRIIEDAVRHHADLNVDTWECHQTCYTRTFYVLQQLEQHVNAWYEVQQPAAMQQLHSQGRRVRVVLACGADLFSSFWRPGCWPLHLLQQLLDTFPVLVVYRDDAGGDVRCADDFERVRRAAPVLRETTADGSTTAELDMRAYTFLFAKFAEADDTSSTAVRELAAAIARTNPPDVPTLEKLKGQLASMVPADAVSSIIACYGSA